MEILIQLGISIITIAITVWLFRMINKADQQNIRPEDYFHYKRQHKAKTAINKATNH